MTTKHPTTRVRRPRPRIVVGALTTMLLAIGGVLAVTASPAAAAPKLELSDNGPFKGGEKVTVTLTGFTPNAPIAVGIIPASRFPAEGPGDACAQKLGCSALLVADAQGGLTKELTVVKGPIENSKAPAETCDAENDCVFGAANINENSETAKADITYVANGSDPTPTSSATPTGTADPTNTATPTSTATTTALPDTGPGAATTLPALAGIAALQVGLILAVRSARARPRGVH
jgi:hypothetical protein